MLSHTKYEQNRSTFDDAQNFGPFYFDNTEKGQSKFLICCLKKANLTKKQSKSTVKRREMGPVFNREDAGSKLRNGRCAQTVGPGSKIFSPGRPPYWVVLTPLSNPNSTDEIYIPLSKFSHSCTLKITLRYKTRHE